MRIRLAFKLLAAAWTWEDGEIRAKRGYAAPSGLLCRPRSALSTRPLRELDGIINDLECGEADAFSRSIAPSGGTPLASVAFPIFWSSRPRHSGFDSRAIDSSPVDGSVPEVTDVLARARCQLAECRLERASEERIRPPVESALANFSP